MSFPRRRNLMKRINTLTLICFAVFTVACRVAPQDFVSLAEHSAKVREVLFKFSGQPSEFTAVFQYQVLDRQGVPRTQMTIEMMVAREAVRDDYLVMAMPQIPEEHRMAMKATGTDRIVSITRIDMKKVYLTFPKLKMFQELPFKESAFNETTARSKNLTLQKTEIGREDVNGYTCTKSLVEVTEVNGPPQKAVIWYASDLKQFPVRMALRQDSLLHLFEFKNVQLGTPNPALFQIPTN